MDALFRSVAAEAHPSVVLVEQAGRLDYFCSASVVWCDSSSTFIFTQAATLDSFPGVVITAHFHDGAEKTAQLVMRRGDFCILRTQRHPTCAPVEFDASPRARGEYVLVLAPTSRSAVYPLPCDLLQPSLASATVLGGKLIKGSSHKFGISCPYGKMSPNGVGRLVGGTVFGMDGKAAGIVIGDNNCPVDVADPGEDTDDGYQFKICMSAEASRSMVLGMLADSGVREGSNFRKRKVKKDNKKRTSGVGEGSNLRKRKAKKDKKKKTRAAEKRRRCG